MGKLPAAFSQFATDYPEMYRAYEQLNKATHEAGPLDERTRHMVKLAIAVGARLEGAVRSHVRKAREAGVSEAELEHVILLAFTTIGLPSMMAARSWMKSLEERASA